MKINLEVTPNDVVVRYSFATPAFKDQLIKDIQEVTTIARNHEEMKHNNRLQSFVESFIMACINHHDSQVSYKIEYYPEELFNNK